MMFSPSSYNLMPRHPLPGELLPRAAAHPIYQSAPLRPAAQQSAILAAPLTATPLGVSGIESALGLWARLLGAFEAFALQFDLAELGDIELPPATAPAAAQANLQLLAPLYLAAALEETRLLAAVEALAGVFASGGLRHDPGPAAELLLEFWRGRRERFNTAERRALFAHLFGSANGPALAARGGSNAAFENLMINLTEALAQRAQIGARIAGDVQLRVAAQQLAANLLERNSGFATLAARELLGDIKTALAVLHEPAVQQAAGAQSVWMAVRNLARLYLHEEIEISTHLTRGQAGLLVLAWLAQVAAQLGGYDKALVQPGDQVVGAALNWLQASLALAEQQSARQAS